MLYRYLESNLCSNCTNPREKQQTLHFGTDIIPIEISQFTKPKSLKITPRITAEV